MSTSARILSASTFSASTQGAYRPLSEVKIGFIDIAEKAKAAELFAA